MTDPVFTSAAHAFARLVRSIPENAWDGPGLGEWDLRALVGHTSRSLITVSEYLQKPAAHEDITDAAAYYVWVRDFTGAAGAHAINERGRQAGLALGDDPSAVVDGLVAKALGDIETAGDPVISVIGGLGIRLSHYLQTRVFELTVHAMDIAAAVGVDVEVELPADAVEQTAVLATRVAARLGHGPALLGALTGRRPLPPGFSVV